MVPITFAPPKIVHLYEKGDETDSILQVAARDRHDENDDYRQFNVNVIKDGLHHPSDRLL